MSPKQNITIIALIALIMAFKIPSDDWGFYGHKLINRMAVYTLPSDLIEFYKSNIQFISDHAVDPDKRRYAVNGEAIKHYIDLDAWTGADAKPLSRDLYHAIIFHSNFYLINDRDSILMFDTLAYKENKLIFNQAVLNKFLLLKNEVDLVFFSRWMRNIAWREYESAQWNVSTDSLKNYADFGDYKIWIDDNFTKHGILPYSLEQTYSKLVTAFENKNYIQILKLSSDIGHYIGDAHVPLHTTKNYNGQLTNQDGIHAFWESRIPELLAEKEFDFLVGGASYIENKKDFFWSVILKSHSYVDSVLFIEKRISMEYPKEQQYCFESRLGVLTKLPCENYTKLYNALLDNQVEDRMRESILAIGSIWTSAWVDAGQPHLQTQKINENDTPRDSFNVKLDLKLRDHE
jgi:hypothetical protein